MLPDRETTLRPSLRLLKLTKHDGVSVFVLVYSKKTLK